LFGVAKVSGLFCSTQIFLGNYFQISFETEVFRTDFFGGLLKIRASIIRAKHLQTLSQSSMNFYLERGCKDN
jgi:hypothetical protein